MNFTSKIENNCTTVRIDHSEASYGIFCFNTQGDLFLNSDWGNYCYAWRSFGNDFREFLESTNTSYIVGKLGQGYFEMTMKKLPKHKEKNLTLLVESFLETLKQK